MARYTFYLAGSTIVGSMLLTTAVFLHDAFTYSERVRLIKNLSSPHFLSKTSC